MSHEFRIEDFNKERTVKIVFPEEILDFIREIANRHHTTDVDVVKKIFKAGLAIIEGVDKKGEVFVLRNQDGLEQEIIIFDEDTSGDSSDMP